MLLGIGLHTAMAYIPGRGLVDQSQTNGLFAVFLTATHGFRMPLFFLLSGFFTAMLWRRRGLRALINHRFKRVFVPCILGLVTIIPVLVGITVLIRRTAPQGKMAESIWTASAQGNIEKISRQIDQGAAVDAQSPRNGRTPLIIATTYGRFDAVAHLLNQGAAVNLRGRDTGTPLHAAAFFGRAEIARLLIQHGADTDATMKDGLTPLGATQFDWRDTQRIAGMMMRVKLDEPGVQAGRFEIARMLGAESHSNSVRDATLTERYRRVTGARVFRSGPFAHLWFLW